MTATRLMQFAKQFGKYCDHRFAPLAQAYGLSMREINVLLFLSNNPGYDTARDITEYRGISKSQVSQAVEFLVELSYLTRTPDPDDRRLLHLALTEEGLALARECKAVQARCGQDLLDGMTEDQVRQLQELWDMVMANGERLSREVDQ